MKKTWAIGLALALAVLCGVFWVFDYSGNDYSDDPEVAEIERIRDTKFSNPEEMTKDDMRVAGDAIKKQAEGLSADQKKELWERSMHIVMPMMMKKAEADMDRFLALSQDEQIRELDKKIAEEQQKGTRNSAEKKSPRSPAEVAEFLKKMNDWTTPEQRAKFETIVGMYNKRKEEQGL